MSACLLGWAYRTAVIGLLIGGLGACAVPPAVPVVADTPPRMLDLSHVVRQDVPYLPGEAPTRLLRDPSGRLEALTIGTRTGTNVQLVAAADSSVRSIEHLAAQDLLLPAALIDMRDQAQDQPSFRLSIADVLAWEARHGPIPAGSLVLLATGWDVRWGDPQAYLALDERDRPQVPGFAAATLDFLLAERAVAGFGLDTPVLDVTPASGFCLLLTNLTSLEQVPASGARILVGVLNIQAAAGAPARVLAMLPAGGSPAE